MNGLRVWIILLFGGGLEPALSEVATGNDYPVAGIHLPVGPQTDDHWSFQPIRRPALPAVTSRDWARNPIDLFILCKCESENVMPGQDADRGILLRRICFDLTGLPPSPALIRQFSQDSRPDAYERLLDRLLASHSYGIRRAQYWLDLARFAETDGFEHDKIRPNAWKYRDWVISAFNQDMAFDQFVTWQLAGDEASPRSAGQTATTFCLSGPDMPDINSQDERRHNVLNELTGTLGSTLLGIQLGCAQCHDHKYDPITQEDFYRLRAIFEPALQLRKNVSLNVLEEQTKRTTPRSFLMIRGDWQRQGHEVTPGVPAVISPNATYSAEPQGNSTGRRRGFARWVTDVRNPLTARVIVNRIWHYHFGEGLVSTPNDFGLMGEAPTHPQLLDWLAAELMDHDWSLKHLSRLILTSSTYRQQETRQDGAEPIAPELWARFPRRRLSGEVLRDTMLEVAGMTNHQMGGPGVRPPIPDELSQTLLKDQWIASGNPADHYRRSIFIFARRNLRYPLFEVFDRPDGNQSCPRRNRSVTAPQSLHLLNSELVMDLSRRLAGDVLKKRQDMTAAVTTVFLRTLGREPRPAETAALLDFVRQASKEEEKQPGNDQALPIPIPDSWDPATSIAFTYLCLAIFNTNEFLYID